ncbi:MAG TPA: ATP-binding protein, partial [Prolixibacteraceae bacterium]
KEKREAVYTKPFEAIQSNTSFEVWVPVFKENVFIGLFAGVYSCDKLLKSCLPDEDYGNTRVSLIEANANILASYPKSYNETKGVMYEKYLAPLYNTMGVRVETISVQTFGWTMIILISLIVILVFSFAYSLFKVSIENRLRKEAQNELEKREITLKQQNIEYYLLTEEYKSQNENLIKARTKAEESDRLKSAFLANMSHEIRTPMNGILGFSELLKAPNLSGEEQQRYISIIEKSGIRMLNIINDIIDISKIESGSMNLLITETNVNDIFEYIYTFFKPEMVKKGIQPSIKRNLPVGEAIINTDREKFIAIMTNLVKNAIKYTNTGTIEFGCDRKGSYVEFFVKDTGIGVPEDRQQAIFERFIQADISDTMALQGAGLGLSITKAYVEMLNGKIWMESEEGKGSIFYFTLPCNAEQEEKNVAQKTTADKGTENRVLPEVSGLKILIAEDDETSALFGSISVQKISREIIKTKNGLEAVDICRKHPDIDLILMDIQMPGLNGHDATRQIRQFNSKVVIIAQTAYGLTGDREKAINAGCNDYIAKPINKNELLALIQMYFAK